MLRPILVLLLSIPIVLSSCTPASVQPAAANTPPAEKTPQPQNTSNSLLTPTGFYWPTGKPPDVKARWLASGCNGQDGYFTGEYHTGVDIKAELKDPVVAIADGCVIYISPGGWDLGGNGDKKNVGVLIEHHLKDGSSFIAIYGHLQTDMQKGDHVQAGQQIGTIGHWPGQDHLHLTISPGRTAKAPYGRLPCPASEAPLDANGTADPLVWLTTQYPGPYLQCGPTPTPPPADPTTPAPPKPLPGATPKPNVTPMPAAATPALDTALLRGLESFYLTFDKAKWEAVPLGDNNTFFLKHRTYRACEVRGNQPRGVPDDWVRSDSRRTIAGNDYAVRTFATATGSPLELIYYVSADGSRDVTVRCFDTPSFLQGSEPQLGDNPEMCIRDAEEAIALSAARSFLAQ
jgi:murein DD-endopeptidase MepM/ murein hydrolase activator NlpD